MKHFTPDESLIFGFLIEECSEVIKAVSKADRFGWENHKPGSTTTNAQELAQEIADVMAVLALINEKFPTIAEHLSFSNLQVGVVKKIKKLQKYHPEAFVGVDLTNITGE